jgi:nitroreductase
MSVINAIRERRSHKRFTDKPIGMADIRALLDAAVLAPNHKMTQPWGFVVLGRLARRRYGELKASAKVRGEMDPALASEKKEKIAAEIAAVPAVIVVTQKVDADPVRAEEDYAAVWMAIENMLLLATSMRLGSKVNTGSITDELGMRHLIDAAEDERIVAIVHVGEPVEDLPAKARIAASEKTRWLP